MIVAPTEQERAWEAKIAEIVHDGNGQDRRVIAIRNIPKNTFVAIYPGRVTERAEGDYVWEYYRVVDNRIDSKIWRIDAAEGGDRAALLRGQFRDCIGPFINEPKQGKMANLRPVMNLLRHPPALEYYAMRDIRGGDELSICYGDEYSRRGYQTRCTRQDKMPKFLWGAQPTQLRARPGIQEAVAYKGRRIALPSNPAMTVDRRMDERVLGPVDRRMDERVLGPVDVEPRRRVASPRVNATPRESALRELERRHGNLQREYDQLRRQYADVERRYGKISKEDYEAAQNAMRRAMTNRNRAQEQIAALVQNRNAFHQSAINYHARTQKLENAVEKLVILKNLQKQQIDILQEEIAAAAAKNVQFEQLKKDHAELEKQYKRLEDDEKTAWDLLQDCDNEVLALKQKQR